MRSYWFASETIGLNANQTAVVGKPREARSQPHIIRRHHMGRPSNNPKPTDPITAKTRESVVAEVLDMSIPLPGNLSEEKLPGVFGGQTEYWLIAFEWLIKLEWDKNYKMPHPKWVRESLKPQGLLLTHYFKLCERCHTFQDVFPKPLPYENAGRWLGIVLKQLIAIAVWEAAHPYQVIVYSNNEKEAALSIERKALALMKAGQNPFWHPDFPHRATHGSDIRILIECCLYLARDPSSPFSNKYWKPFLKQYSAWIAEMKKPHWSVPVVKNGKVYLRIGKNKGLIFLRSVEDYKKNFSGKTTQERF